MQSHLSPTPVTSLSHMSTRQHLHFLAGELKSLAQWVHVVGIHWYLCSAT